MPKRSVTYATFVIKREYKAAPAKVFAAFADPQQKSKWFGGPGDWEQSDLVHDFRVGGKERLSSGPQGGPVSHYSAEYWDTIENERIVTSYEMHHNEQRISVSLATIELKPNGSGTSFALTEQGAFLDGYDDAGERERGTSELLDKLEGYLQGRT